MKTKKITSDTKGHARGNVSLFTLLETRIENKNFKKPKPKHAQPLKPLAPIGIFDKSRFLKYVDYKIQTLRGFFGSYKLRENNGKPEQMIYNWRVDILPSVFFVLGVVFIISMVH